MVTIWFDGFDHYAFPGATLGPDMANKWTNVGGLGGGDGINSTPGRVSGNGILMNRGVGGGNVAFNIQHSFGANYARLDVGFGYKPTGFGGLIAFWDLTTTQLSITHNANGQIFAVRGVANTGTQLGSSALNVLKLNVWQFVEVRALFASGTGGSVTVAVDGVTVLTLTGINTIISANAYANLISLFGVETSNNQAPAPGNAFDDLFVLDWSTGTGSSGLFGDHRVLTQFPTGNSADVSGHDQWQQQGGTAGNFWTSVSDNPHDSDTSYLTSATAGQIANFTHAALPATVTGIVAVQFNVEARKDDVSTRQIAATQRNATTDSVGPTSPNLSQTYQNVMTLTELSLQTAAAWTLTEWNASEFGVELIT